MASSIVRYDIIDSQSKKVIASRKTRTAATNFADRKDLEYGAVRYLVKAIWSN